MGKLYLKGLAEGLETYRGIPGKQAKVHSMEPSMELCEDSVVIIPECFSNSYEILRIASINSKLREKHRYCRMKSLKRSWDLRLGDPV